MAEIDLMRIQLVPLDLPLNGAVDKLCVRR